MKPSPPNIECHGLTVRFMDRRSQRPRAVIDDLTFSVNEGDIVALLGKSGCGKSTLLRSIAGLQKLDAGDVTIGGQSIEAARSILSFVFQEPALLPWRTALENVCLPLELDPNFGREAIREQAMKLLRTVEFVIGDETKFPPQLSGGMKMRVSLARALVTQPQVLLLDEPFAALDDMLRWRLNELLLLEAKRTQRTMIFVTHNIAEAVFLSQRIAIMHRGKIAAWIENPLPLPRTGELRSTTEFAQMYGQVSKRLSEVAAD
jgi:NitT/TauT family transport system ATP-binding protein